MLQGAVTVCRAQHPSVVNMPAWEVKGQIVCSLSEHPELAWCTMTRTALSDLWHSELRQTQTITAVLGQLQCMRMVTAVTVVYQQYILASHTRSAEVPHRAHWLMDDYIAALSKVDKCRQWDSIACRDQDKLHHELCWKSRLHILLCTVEQAKTAFLQVYSLL